MRCEDISLRKLTISGLAFLVLLSGCDADQLLSVENQDTRLSSSIGIVTAGDNLTEIIPADTSLPHTYSEAYGNEEAGQTEIRITLAQPAPGGIEKILVADIFGLPARPIGELTVLVTVTVDTNRQLVMKASVPEAGYLREYGPVPVR